jgi:hypothetical protein
VIVGPLLFFVSLIWSYVHSILTETKCPIPPLTQFLQIPVYMADFLFLAVLLNIIVDYFSWSITQVGLKRIAALRGPKPVLLVLLTPIAVFVLLYSVAPLAFSRFHARQALCAWHRPQSPL